MNLPEPPSHLPDFVRKEMLSWRSDPAWDLGETYFDPDLPEEAKFLPYANDLQNYQTACEIVWQQRREREFTDFAAEWGLSDNLALAKKVYDLQQTVEFLRDKVLTLRDDYMEHDHGRSK